MYAAARNRPSTSTPTDGSRTMTITNDPTREDEEDSDQGEPEAGEVVGTLRLRGAARQTTRRRQRVVWDEDVVDNEGCGRKKSKICCIYHKPRRFDESSSESDSGSDSEGDVCGHDHDHPHPTPNANQAHPASSSSGVIHEGEAEPNAYERQPNPHSNRGKGKQKAA